MRYGILSDIHGNLEALDAVLVALSGERIGRYLFLGDIIGYGASSNEYVDRLVALKPEVIAGNHDQTAISKLNIASFNQFAAEAVLWTMYQLMVTGRRYLEDIPLTWCLDDLLAVHASPANLREWTISRRLVEWMKNPMPFLTTLRLAF